MYNAKLTINVEHTLVVIVTDTWSAVCEEALLLYPQCIMMLVFSKLLSIHDNVFMFCSY